MSDQAHNQYMREANYCGRFKAWQVAAMFMGFVFMLSGGLPLLCFKVIPYLCQFIAGLL